MAETLGSLVDKLTIKTIRLSFLESGKYVTSDRETKIDLIREQRQALVSEIDEFLERAVLGRATVKDLKFKLYNTPSKVAEGKGVGTLIDNLSLKNLELWLLEDEVRRKDLADAKIVELKRAIDRANQERNDLIDGIDTLLEQSIIAFKDGQQEFNEHAATDPRYSVK